MHSYLDLLDPVTWAALFCSMLFKLKIAQNQAINDQALETSSDNRGKANAIILYDPNNGLAAQAAFDARLKYFLEMEDQPFITPVIQKAFDTYWEWLVAVHQEQRFLDALAKGVFEKQQEQERRFLAFRSQKRSCWRRVGLGMVISGIHPRSFRVQKGV